MTVGVFLRGLLWVVAMILLGVSLRSLGQEIPLDSSWIDSRVRGQGIAGEWLFLGAGVLFTSLGLPRQMLSFFGGYAFGVTLGCLLSLLASVAGCILVFYLSRLLGRTLVERWFPLPLRRIDRFVAAHPLHMTLLIRLLPVGSNLATNVAAGVSSMRGMPFFTGSLLGYLPQTLIFALIGSGFVLEPGWRIQAGILLFLCSSLLGWHLYRRNRAGFQQLEKTAEACSHS